jgi:hypothetical protein
MVLQMVAILKLQQFLQQAEAVEKPEVTAEIPQPLAVALAVAL